jgi:hypothetical protein
MHFDPCIPPFPRWLVVSSCSAPESNDSSQMAVILSLVLTFYILANLVASAAYGLLYGPLGMTFAFLTHLHYIKNRNQKLRVSCQPFHRRIITFRGVHLLVSLFNDCYQWVFFTVILFMGYFIVSMNLFIFVRLHADTSSAMSSILGLLTAEGFFCIFILNSLSGKVYHSSCGLLTSWSRNAFSESSSSSFPKIWIKSPYDPAKVLRYEWAPLTLLTG